MTVHFSKLALRCRLLIVTFSVKIVDLVRARPSRPTVVPIWHSRCTAPETAKPPAIAGGFILLGYLDSNQEQMNQNHSCCQLHHTPKDKTEVLTDSQA